MFNTPEDQETMRNIGRMGLTIFRGAIDDGATIQEAYVVTAAFFAGMIGGSMHNLSKDA